ncbi:TPA: fumarylacetoacetate hydrolase family protein [Thermoplasmata archaeon]|nr:fumarylacetoacetate hydrolase family protein [Thermoplasmata archaeon]
MYGKFRSGERIFAGVVNGGKVVELDTDRISNLFDAEPRETARTHALRDLRVLPPVDRPSKIICIGLNYKSHIKEMAWETPSAPIIFTKPSSAIVGHDDDIVLPELSERVDYEGESAIVIGRRASHVSDGDEFIFGYTALNDVTARDLQKADPDWTRAKGFDTFAPIGPLLSSAPPTMVTTRLNGRTVQQSPTDDRVFGDSALVEYISSIMVLEPGDVIATGTPSGISPMSDGDVVEVELDTVGVLRNRVRANRRRKGVD